MTPSRHLSIFRNFAIAVPAVLKKPAYFAFAAAASAVVLIGIVVIPNVKLLGFVFSERAFSPGLKLSSAAQILWNGRVVFASVPGAIAIVMALLFGLHLAMTAYYLGRTSAARKAAGTGVLGVLVGLFGVGCAACGSVLLASVVGAGAALSLSGLLPFRGLEFALLGLLILLGAIAHTAKKISDPDACHVQARSK